MEEIKNITEPMIKEMLNKKYTKTEILLIESIRRIKNPFRMISVKDVMRDLHICENVAYKTFKRPDFPSINIGKNNQVMLLPYLIWKMEKRD
ncbi:MAG: hypothetical protein K1W33_03260 [Clostridia bacterium]